MNPNYVLRPKADKDLDDQALYLARQAPVELGHRFLIAAHETFILLASNAEIGWALRFDSTDLKSVRVFPMKDSNACSCFIALLLMELRFFA